MGILRFLFGDRESSDLPRIPTAPFDKRQMTPTLKEDIRKSLAEVPELRRLSAGDFNRIYNAAVESIERGRNIHLLLKVLQNISRVPRRQAGEIAIRVHGRATAAMASNRQQSLGITHAIWMYSGAPCSPHPSRATAVQKRQDAAHARANGRRFEVVRGLKLNGVWVKPGEAEFCKCSYKSVIPGLE